MPAFRDGSMTYFDTEKDSILGQLFSFPNYFYKELFHLGSFFLKSRNTLKTSKTFLADAVILIVLFL